MALLMLPRVVLTHLKAGFRAALRPDPVMIGWWTQPALPTPVKQCRPSQRCWRDGNCAAPRSRFRHGGNPSHGATSSGLACPLVLFRPPPPSASCQAHPGPAWPPAAPLPAVAPPAEIGIVDLDPSRQALCGVPLHHRLHELVLDLPGGGLGDAKPAAQLNAGDAALALSEVVHGAKPSTQRHLGRRENRSGDHGCLPSTGGTLVKRPGLDEAVMLPCANRADKAGWPAPEHHRLPALILCSVKDSKLGLAEPLLKLHLFARHRSNPQKQPYVPVSYHDLMVEDSA